MAKTKKEKKIKGVTLHKSGRWMYRFQYDGKNFCGYADTQRQAAEALEKARYEAKNGSYLDPNCVTLDSFFQSWHETYIAPSKKQKTAETYSILYNLHISPVFGKSKLQKIQGIMIQKWINELAKEYSAQTVKLTRTIFYMILDQAVKNDIITTNPITKITMPALKVAEKKEALTAEQEDLFFQYCRGNRFYVLFRLAALTGARIGELTALTWNDIDLEKGTMNITKTLCDSDEKGFVFNAPKSKAGTRNLSLVPEAVTLLRQYKVDEYTDRLQKGTRKERAKMRMLLFHTSTLAPLPSRVPNKELKMIAERMRADGIDIPNNFTVHTLRHCFATRAIEGGMDYKTLSQYMGHSSIKITLDIYASTSKEKEQQELLKIADYL